VHQRHGHLIGCNRVYHTDRPPASTTCARVQGVYATVGQSPHSPRKDFGHFGPIRPRRPGRGRHPDHDRSPCRDRCLPDRDCRDCRPRCLPDRPHRAAWPQRWLVSRWWWLAKRWWLARRRRRLSRGAGAAKTPNPPAARRFIPTAVHPAAEPPTPPGAPAPRPGLVFAGSAHADPAPAADTADATSGGSGRRPLRRG
jgi:hypothetical protein